MTSLLIAVNKYSKHRIPSVLASQPQALCRIRSFSSTLAPQSNIMATPALACSASKRSLFPASGPTRQGPNAYPHHGNINPNNRSSSPSHHADPPIYRQSSGTWRDGGEYQGNDKELTSVSLSSKGFTQLQATRFSSLESGLGSVHDCSRAETCNRYNSSRTVKAGNQYSEFMGFNGTNAESSKARRGRVSEGDCPIYDMDISPSRKRNLHDWASNESRQRDLSDGPLSAAFCVLNDLEKADEFESHTSRIFLESYFRTKSFDQNRPGSSRTDNSRRKTLYVKSVFGVSRVPVHGKLQAQNPPCVADRYNLQFQVCVLSSGV